ncbi:hypothetical protein KAR91_71865, partial [Candidatus Pacearchaeota archaeon]|nr:hypothetical protein [Candidatus Pacearchaeota archaeon]
DFRRGDQFFSPESAELPAKMSIWGSGLFSGFVAESHLSERQRDSATNENIINCRCLTRRQSAECRWRR